MKSESNPDLLNRAEAAEFLGIAPRTLDDWREAGAIASIERPGYVRFLRSDLKDFLQRHRREARSDSPKRETKRGGPRREKASAEIMPNLMQQGGPSDEA